MFTMDMPKVPPQYTPIVLTQAAVAGAPPADAVLQPDFLFKDCKEVPSAKGEMSALNTVDPAGMLVVTIGNREHRDIDPNTAISKVTLLESPKHGKFIHGARDSGVPVFAYVPEVDYDGKEKAVFMVEFEGKRYKVVVNLIVQRGVDPHTPLCPPEQFIKLDPKPASGSSDYNLNSITVSYQPNPAFERDSPRSAASPSILR